MSKNMCSRNVKDMGRKKQSIKDRVVGCLVVAVLAGGWFGFRALGALASSAPSSNGAALTPVKGTSASNVAYEVPRNVSMKAPEQLLRRYAYTTSYNKSTRNPNWVGWVLTADHTDGPYARGGHKFEEDMDVPSPRAAYYDIREGECGYQRGHMCPAGDNKWSYRAQKEAFLMTNICPQNGNLNERDWQYLEKACRNWAKKYGKIYIVAGPVFRTKSHRTVGEHHVAVPDAFFKVVLALGKGKSGAKAIGFVYENKAGRHKMEYYARSVDAVEKMTGLDFFHQLDDVVENKIEAQCNLANW